MTPGRWRQWPWEDDAFSGAQGTIGGITCPVVSIRALLAIKEGYETYTGLPLRLKDRADVEHLRRIAAPDHGDP